MNLAPFQSETLNDTTSYPENTTLTRDFLLCASPPSSESEAAQIVLQSLKNGEAHERGLVSSSWNIDRDTGTYSTPPKPSAIADQLTVMAIFDGGSVSLDVFPHLGFCRVSVTNLNSQVSPDEIFATFRMVFDPKLTLGSASHTNPPQLTPSRTLDTTMSHFGDKQTASLNYWRLSIPYVVSPKTELRVSPVEGKGNWAKDRIAKGEVILDGPLDSLFGHLEEFRLFPNWKQLYHRRYSLSEQPHEEVFVVVHRTQLDSRLVSLKPLL